MQKAIQLNINHVFKVAQHISQFFNLDLIILKDDILISVFVFMTF